MLSLSPSDSRGHAAVRGLIAAAVGAVLIAWPGITIGTVVVLFAIYAVADAVAVATRAIKGHMSTGDRVLLGLRSLIEVIAAGVALAYPDVTASIMTVVIGIYAITVGGLELAGVGLLAKAGVSGYGRKLAGGLLTVMTGVALVVWPGIGAVTLALVFGAYLTVAGAVLLVSAAVAPRHRAVPSAA